MPSPPLTVADLRRQVAIGQVDVSPDGRLVAYTRRTVVQRRDRIGLWIVPWRGGRARRLTDGPHRDVWPRFSPDGALLSFVSDREGGVPQVFVLPLAGGEPWPVTRFARGVQTGDAPGWHPDGRAIAVIAEDEASRVDVGRFADGAPTAREIRRIDWRLDGVGLLTHPAHVHVVPVAPAGGRPARGRRLTEGPWRAARPRFSPDGRTVAFLADPRPDGDLEPLPAVHGVAASGGPPRVLADLPGPARRYSWEPDGALVVLAHDVRTPRDHHAPRLWHVPARGAPRIISAATDRFLGEGGDGTDLNDWQTGHDDRGRLTTVSDGGRVVPHRFDDAAPVPLVAAGHDPMTHDLACGGGRVAAVMTLAGAPPEVYALEETGAPRALTSHGGAWLRRLRPPVRRELAVDGPAGAVHTFLELPPGDGPHPTVLLVHGGPTGSWGPAPPVEALLLAGAGYAVARPNIRGSNDRGPGWVQALSGDWGGADAEDCHAVLDRLVADGVADPRRLGCLGLSYGGFMVNWLVGTSDRFAAAVSENGVSNQVSCWGNSDCGVLYNEAAGLGNASDPAGAERLWRTSPLRHAAAIRTPLLMLQAEADLRCPPSDNEQLFLALRWRRRPVEYVLYPEESHVFQAAGRFDRREDRHRRVLGWFARHMPV